MVVYPLLLMQIQELFLLFFRALITILERLVLEEPWVEQVLWFVVTEIMQCLNIEQVNLLIRTGQDRCVLGADER